MIGQGISQIVVYSIVLIALGYPLGIWMARIYTAERVGGRRVRLASSIESGFYRLVRIDPTQEQDWKSYGTTVLVFSVLFWAVLYAIQRLQGHLFLNPDHMKGVPVAPLAEHGRQLHHEHELAVLRRRVHDVVPHADGRPGGAELRLGRGRDGRARGGRARDRAPLVRARSATSGSTSTARSSTSCCRSSIVVAVAPDLAGRAADAPRPRDGDDAPGRARRRSRAARSPRRSRSSSSGRTAAASTTRTRPSRSRTRPGSRTSSSCSRSC